MMGDYHHDMNNSVNFTNYVCKQLILNLPDRSVVMMDKVSYHNNKYVYSSSWKDTNERLIA
jgi:SRSO17 transposase